MIDKILYILFAIPFFSQLNPTFIFILGCLALITLPFIVIKLRIFPSLLVGALFAIPIWLAISGIISLVFFTCNKSITSMCLGFVTGLFFGIFVTLIFYFILYYLKIAYYFKYQRKSN